MDLSWMKHDSEPFMGISDKDLLNELRVRGRLVEADYHTICPGHVVSLGYPAEAQIEKTFTRLGAEIAKIFVQGRKIPNCYFEAVSPEFGYGMRPDRKFTTTLMFVVDK